jgi:hypothetical protein
MCHTSVSLCAKARLLVCAVCLFVPSAAFTPYTATTLEPRKPLRRQTITLNSEVKRYRLTRLLPNSGYEVRVSYPATVSINSFGTRVATSRFAQGPAFCMHDNPTKACICILDIFFAFSEERLSVQKPCIARLNFDQVSV